MDGPDGAQGAVAALDAAVEVGAAGREDMRGGMPASRRAVSNSCMNSESPLTCTEFTGRRCRASWRKSVAVAAVALERTLMWMPLVRVLGVELLEGSAIDLHGHVIELDGLAGQPGFKAAAEVGPATVVVCALG